jgi:hypothetical protein
MMLFLIPHIRFGFVTIRRTDGEHTVAPLPIKPRIFLPKRLDELGEFPFALFNKIDRRSQFAHVEEDVDMIGNSAYHNPRRIHTSDSCRQEGMNSWPNRIVQERLAVLGAEDQVRAKLRERLRHGYLLNQ